MDPRIREIMEMLQNQVSIAQANPRTTTGEAAKQDEKLSTEELAFSVNLSESRLLVLFKADTGLTPMQYLKKLKMERAREMAENTHLKITEILEIFGFDNPSHFRRDFKREHGSSLIECRRKWREDGK
jgi:transcriptional regulator GlxA family with amidase domain